MCTCKSRWTHTSQWHPSKFYRGNNFFCGTNNDYPWLACDRGPNTCLTIEVRHLISPRWLERGEWLNDWSAQAVLCMQIVMEGDAFLIIFSLWTFGYLWPGNLLLCMAEMSGQVITLHCMAVWEDDAPCSCCRPQGLPNTFCKAHRLFEPFNSDTRPPANLEQVSSMSCLHTNLQGSATLTLVQLSSLFKSGRCLPCVMHAIICLVHGTNNLVDCRTTLHLMVGCIILLCTVCSDGRRWCSTT